MRENQSIFEGKPVIEGAGVLLKRIFGYNEVPQMDPFLLLDHFGSPDSRDYIKGFPWHPHRGIETITYMIQGKVEHGDSLGNQGVIESGQVQWMTAGSGIIHQEMPQEFEGEMKGFQLWVNLPKEKKMTEPKYRSIEVLKGFKKNDAQIKIISGELDGEHGPSNDLNMSVDYYDIDLSGRIKLPCDKKTAFLYVYEGELQVAGQALRAEHLGLLESSGELDVQGKGKFIFVAGNPLKEAVAWGGPIVMNTEAELNEAFSELEHGNFIKVKR